jgi:hypothetical protein
MLMFFPLLPTKGGTETAGEEAYGLKLVRKLKSEGRNNIVSADKSETCVTAEPQSPRVRNEKNFRYREMRRHMAFVGSGSYAVFTCKQVS